MRVLLDATAMPPDRGGVGRYIDALLPELDGDGVKIAVICRPDDTEGFGKLIPKANIVSGPSSLIHRPLRIAWEQSVLPGLVRRLKADVLHSPHYTMPAFSPVPVVVTLHDATFFTHPDLHSPIKARFFRSAIRNAVRNASSLVVPSRATRDEVLREAGGDIEDFHVAYHGVDTGIFHPVDRREETRVRAKLGLSPDQAYIGFLGTLEPRKNVPSLIRAWVSVMGRTKDPVALILAGGVGWDKQVEPAILNVPDSLTIKRPGYLPLNDLAGFLAGAEIVAYPSLGEGFGLPVLEAMACGACVLTTRELSLPEVGGDAVAYCEPQEASIADAIESLHLDQETRVDLGARAIVRARNYTWAASARVHREAYRAATRAT